MNSSLATKDWNADSLIKPDKSLVPQIKSLLEISIHTHHYQPWTYFKERLGIVMLADNWRRLDPWIDSPRSTNFWKKISLTLMTIQRNF
jgi:hypothetical protein